MIQSDDAFHSFVPHTSMYINICIAFFRFGFVWLFKIISEPLKRFDISFRESTKKRDLQVDSFIICGSDILLQSKVKM